MYFRALVISDDDTPWDVILNSEQIEVTTRSSHQIVATITTAAMYNLVIVDLNNAEHEIELCRKLRTAFDGALLFCSSRTEEQYHLAAYAAGVNEVLLLPLSPPLLRAKIRAWRRRIQLYTHDQPALLPTHPRSR